MGSALEQNRKILESKTTDCKTIKTSDSQNNKFLETHIGRMQNIQNMQQSEHQIIRTVISHNRKFIKAENLRMKKVTNVESHRTAERSLRLKNSRANPTRNDMKLTTIAITQMNSGSCKICTRITIYL